jgi:hypothetical protein
MEIYSFLDANFQLTKASLLSQKERSSINDYFKAKKSAARSLRLFFPSTKTLPFPNPVYFNHLLGFTDHIYMQISPGMCKTMFKAYLKTLTYEKDCNVKKIPASIFHIPERHSITLTKLPYAGKFENKYLPLITNETDIEDLKI